jgi:hypothetical protein
MAKPLTLPQIRQPAPDSLGFVAGHEEPLLPLDLLVDPPEVTQLFELARLVADHFERLLSVYVTLLQLEIAGQMTITSGPIPSG